MTGSDNHSDLIQIATAPLVEEKRQILARIQEIDALIAKITGVQQVASPQISHVPPTPPAPLDEMIAALPIQEAVYEVMLEHDHPGKPVALTTGEVKVSLALKKYPFNQKNENLEVQHALKRRARVRGDVVKISVAKWGLRKNYTDKELKEFEHKVGGNIATRDTAKHRQATKDAMAKLRAEGRWVGGAPKLRPEHWEMAVHLVRDKGYTIREAHKAIATDPSGEKDAFCYGTLNKYRADIENGRSYPEKLAQYFGVEVERTTDKENDHIRLVTSS